MTTSKKRPHCISILLSDEELATVTLHASNAKSRTVASYIRALATGAEQNTSDKLSITDAQYSLIKQVKPKRLLRARRTLTRHKYWAVEICTHQDDPTWHLSSKHNSYTRAYTATKSVHKRNPELFVRIRAWDGGVQVIF